MGSSFSFYPSPLTTKGDVFTHNGSNSTRLAVGANGYSLVADSAEANGLKWAALAISNVASLQAALDAKANLTTANFSGAVSLGNTAFSVPEQAVGTVGATLLTLWNAAGSTFDGLTIDATDAASAAASRLLKLSVGGVTRLAVEKNGGMAITHSSFSTVVGPATGNFGANFTAISGGAAKWSIGGNVGCYHASDFVLKWNSGTDLNSGAPDTGLVRSAAGVVEFNNGTAGTLRDWKARRGELTEYLDVVEMTAPAAPAANTARLYVEDNGAGKTRLMVLFPTGAAQVLATEP